MQTVRRNVLKGMGCTRRGNRDTELFHAQCLGCRIPQQPGEPEDRHLGFNVPQSGPMPTKATTN